MNLTLTDDKAKQWYDTLMACPNHTNTYPILVDLVNAMREHAEPKPENIDEVEIS